MVSASLPRRSRVNRHGDAHGQSAVRVTGREVSFFLLSTLDPLKLIGPLLGGGVPWWKFPCGGSEQQYAQ